MVTPLMAFVTLFVSFIILFPLSITFYRFLPYLDVLAMHRNGKQLQQLQANLATAHAEIQKLQQENALLRKQLAPKPSTTDIPPSPSGRTTSPTVSSLSRNPPTPFKRFSSTNNAFPPPPKVTHPKQNNSQPSLAAIARQFSSPAEPADFKLIHIPLRHRLPLQPLRTGFRK
jgi:hypothetical protein